MKPENEFKVSLDDGNKVIVRRVGIYVTSHPNEH
jgi:hypothetical protein